MIINIYLKKQKKFLRIVENNGSININTILQEITKYYDGFHSYIELWENSFGEAKSFTWTSNNKLIWSKDEASDEKINETFVNNAVNMETLKLGNTTSF